MMKWLVVLSFVAGAALSWGVYVPVVHRAAFELKSNLRAFMFVGAAYFVVAVLIPAFFIFVAKSDPTVNPGTVPNFHLPTRAYSIRGPYIPRASAQATTGLPCHAAKET